VETWLLVKKLLAAGVTMIAASSTSLMPKAIKIAFVMIAVASGSGLSLANERQSIRFYKINKDGITQALRFTASKARTPGCHKFIRKARLHRVVQFQYKVCRVYSKKGCDAESLMSFYRDKEPTPTTELKEGFGWYPVGDHERGEKAKSWFCE
jgi:hypothetical protein